MPKTITHEFPMHQAPGGQKIVDDFTRPNPLDHTRFDKADCYILTLSGRKYYNTTVINESYLNPGPTLYDEAQVKDKITLRNERFFKALNAALKFLSEVTLPRCFKVRLVLAETTVGVPNVLLRGYLGRELTPPTPLGNIYSAGILIESEFGISELHISEKDDVSDIGCWEMTQSKLGKELQEAVKKALEAKTPVAA